MMKCVAYEDMNLYWCRLENSIQHKILNGVISHTDIRMNLFVHSYKEVNTFHLWGDAHLTIMFGGNLTFSECLERSGQKYLPFDKYMIGLIKHFDNRCLWNDKYTELLIRNIRG